MNDTCSCNLIHILLQILMMSRPIPNDIYEFVYPVHFVRYLCQIPTPSVAVFKTFIGSIFVDNRASKTTNRAWEQTNSCSDRYHVQPYLCYLSHETNPYFLAVRVVCRLWLGRVCVDGCLVTIQLIANEYGLIAMFPMVSCSGATCSNLSNWSWNRSQIVYIMFGIFHT